MSEEDTIEVPVTRRARVTLIGRVGGKQELRPGDVIAARARPGASWRSGLGRVSASGGLDYRPIIGLQHEDFLYRVEPAESADEEEEEAALDSEIAAPTMPDQLLDRLGNQVKAWAGAANRLEKIAIRAREFVEAQEGLASGDFSADKFDELKRAVDKLYPPGTRIP